MKTGSVEPARTTLWQRHMPDWGWSAWTGKPNTESRTRFDEPLDVTCRLVASDRRVYVALGEHALLGELDATTGKTVRTFPGTKRLSEILHVDNRLIVSVHRPADHLAKRGTTRPLFQEELQVFDSSAWVGTPRIEMKHLPMFSKTAEL